MRNLLAFQADHDYPVGLHGIYRMLGFVVLLSCKEIYTLVFPEVAFETPRSWFKGADTTAVCIWFEDYLTRHLETLEAQDPYLTSMLASFRAANMFLRVLFRSGLFLSLDRCHTAAQAGLDYMRTYQELAYQAFHVKKKTRFKITPKLHAFLHIVDHLCSAVDKKRRWTWSPVAEMVQMDEDFVGRVASLTTSVASRKVHIQSIRKYLTNVWTHLRRVKCKP